MREMESGESRASAPAGRDTPDDLRVTSLNGDEARSRRAGQLWRWGLRLGALAAVVGLAATLVAALEPLMPRPAAAPPPPEYIALALAPELRFCATNGYWSPDGRYIAVPRAPTCGAGVAGVSDLPDIYIYDAANGEQVTEYTIMPTIEGALARAGLSGAQISFSSVTWSPDQRMLAAQFEVYQALPRASSGMDVHARGGVALITISGPHTGAVTALISASGLSLVAEGAGFTPGPLAVDEWDTRQLSARRLDLPAALGYEWLPGDLLISADPPQPGGASATPTLADTAGPMGNPTGGQRFSMWRTDSLVEVSAADCGPGDTGQPARRRAPLTALYFSTTAWSPDGRYLLTITQVARAPQAPALNTDTPRPPFCLPASAASALPQAPIHDRAMRAALGQLGDVMDVELLWSPDGARLAELPSANSQLSSAITLYSTLTGAVLARISAGPSQIPGAQGSDANALFINGAWSPDGRRLLTVVEGQQFNIRVYGPRSLG